MSEEARGLTRVFRELLYSLMISALLQSFRQILAQTYPQSQSYVPLFDLLIGLFMSMTFVRKMKYWHSAYVVGWVAGIGLVIYLGLTPLSKMGPLDWSVNIAIPVITLVFRAKSHIED